MRCASQDQAKPAGYGRFQLLDNCSNTLANIEGE
jgi:hypothetical protein